MLRYNLHIFSYFSIKMFKHVFSPVHRRRDYLGTSRTTPIQSSPRPQWSFTNSKNFQHIHVLQVYLFPHLSVLILEVCWLIAHIPYVHLFLKENCLLWQLVDTLTSLANPLFALKVILFSTFNTIYFHLCAPTIFQVHYSQINKIFSSVCKQRSLQFSFLANPFNWKSVNAEFWQEFRLAGTNFRKLPLTFPLAFPETLLVHLKYRSITFPVHITHEW